MELSSWFNTLSLGIAGGGLLGVWWQARLGPVVFVIGIAMVTMGSAMSQEFGLDE